MRAATSAWMLDSVVVESKTPSEEAPVNARDNADADARTEDSDMEPPQVSPTEKQTSVDRRQVQEGQLLNWCVGLKYKVELQKVID